MPRNDLGQDYLVFGGFRCFGLLYFDTKLLKMAENAVHRNRNSQKLPNFADKQYKHVAEVMYGSPHGLLCTSDEGKSILISIHVGLDAAFDHRDHMVTTRSVCGGRILLLDQM